MATFTYSTWFDENGQKQNTRTTITYEISYTDTHIIVNGHKMKVKKDYEYTYKVQKTQIRAIDGAEGLFNFLTEPIEFMCSIKKSLCDYIVAHGKQ